MTPRNRFPIAILMLALLSACDQPSPDPVDDRDGLGPTFVASLDVEPGGETDCRDAYFCALDTCASDLFAGELTIAEAHACALSCEPTLAGSAFVWGQYLNASLDSCGFGWGNAPDVEPSDSERTCLAAAWNPWTGDAGIAGERLSTCMRSGAQSL